MANIPDPPPPYALNKFFWPEKFGRAHRTATSWPVKPNAFDFYVAGKRMPGTANRAHVDRKLNRPVSAWLDLPLFALMRNPGMTSKAMYRVILPYPRLVEALYEVGGATTMVAARHRTPEQLASFLVQLDAQGDVWALIACMVLMRQAIESNDGLGYMRTQQVSYRLLLRLVILWPWSRQANELCSYFHDAFLSVLKIPTETLRAVRPDKTLLDAHTSGWTPAHCPDFDAFMRDLQERHVLLRCMSDLGLLQPDTKAHRACVHAAETLGLAAIMVPLRRYAEEANRYSAALNPRITELCSAMEQSRALVEDLPGIGVSIRPAAAMLDALAVNHGQIPPG